MSSRSGLTTPLRGGGARVRALLVLLALMAPFSSGCATYSDKMAKVMETTTAGDFEASITKVEKIMGVGQRGQMPEKIESETALGLLERGTLEQALFDYPGSSRDFIVADRELQVLDLTDDTAGNIGRYVYSDSATLYQATPTEKLSLNSFNMANFLANGDLRGSRVEARRFTVMQTYLENSGIEEVHVAIGSYLAGFTFEMLGEWQGAIRYYDEALQAQRFESLGAPIRRLAPMTSFRGKMLAQVLAQGAAEEEREGAADLLVVVSVGRVPFKVPKRIPIGAAVGMAGAWISGNPEVLGHTAMKFVVYPELVPNGSVYDKVRLRIDDRPAQLELASDLGAEITREYEEIKPRIIGAAISRMIVRAAASEGVRQAGNQQSAGLGWALALLTEAVMVAMDKPDTRSWMHLPEQVFVFRERLPAGQHEIEVMLGSGGADSIAKTVTLQPGGYAAVVVTSPR
ncbi:MAG: hypothetical protein JRE70_08945 [Deltaproteobacteria bacterium]|nr:hypothetical protein [Deltaproteobacteria bacterium]